MTISVDDDLEKGFLRECRESGLPLSTAMSIFAKAVVRKQSIPLTLRAMSSAEQAVHAYDQYAADEIAWGLAEAASGDVLSRKKSRALRAAVQAPV